jgi:flagellar basal-body rod protein FlgF
MPGLITSAEAIMRASEQRLEAASANVANVSTPGYKRQVSFADLVGTNGAADLDSVDTLITHVRADMAQGKLASTSNPLDIAISGDGMFALRDGTDILYSRQGQFHLAADGTVTTARGQVLQQAGGGDLVLEHAAVVIAADGTVTDAGEQVGKIAVFTPPAGATADPLGGSMFRMNEATAEEVANPELRQGMVEASNVSVGDEMISMMAAMRQAESGAKLAQTWDDLLGQAITKFGGGQ